MFDVFRNLNNRRCAVPFTVAILVMAVLTMLAIMATSLREAPYVLRVDWPALEVAGATDEILEEIA